MINYVKEEFPEAILEGISPFREIREELNKKGNFRLWVVVVFFAYCS